MLNVWTIDRISSGLTSEPISPTVKYLYSYLAGISVRHDRLSEGKAAL